MLEIKATILHGSSAGEIEETAMADQLRDTIPTFDTNASDESGDVSISNWSALTHGNFAKSGSEILAIIAVAVVIIGGLEIWIRSANVKSYIVPTPSAIGSALFHHFDDLFWPHIKMTLFELGVGYAIGATIGILLAAVITQVPFVEKIITPYILLLVTTPMMALVPLLMLSTASQHAPHHRRRAGRRSDGHDQLRHRLPPHRSGQDRARTVVRGEHVPDFPKVRFPLALPMIIVGLMVGAIFGMLTAVGAEMVGGKDGLGNQIDLLARPDQDDNFVWSIIAILALMGIGIYVIFYRIGKRWASWQA